MKIFVSNLDSVTFDWKNNTRLIIKILLIFTTILIYLYKGRNKFEMYF